MARDNRQAKTAEDERPRLLSLLVLHIPFVLAILVTTAGAFLPGQFTWGIDFWSLLPLWLWAIAIFIYVLISYPPISLQLYQGNELLFRGNRRLPGALAVLITIVLLGAIFLLLRSRTMLYGDGWLWVSLSGVSGMDQVLDVHGRLKPLTSIAYRLGNFVLAGSLHFSDQTAFSIMSAIGGVAGAFGIYRLAGILTQSKASRAFLVCCALTSGSAILFFGYTESYVWGTAALLWHLFYSVRKAAEPRSPWTAVIVSGLVMSLLNVVLLPIAIVSVGLLITKRESVDGQVRYLFGWTFARLAVVAISVGLVGVALLRVFGPSRLDFLLHPLPQAEYWLFSSLHLSDLANQLLLVAPLLPGSLVLALAMRSGPRKIQPGQHMLAASAAVAFFFTFWIDPALGAPRDWDLLSSFGFPASIAAGHFVLQRATSLRTVQMIISPAAFMVVFLLAPNLYEKTDPTRTVERLDRLLWSDPHYQQDYRQAYNCFHWSYQLHGMIHRDDLASKYLHRRINALPTDDRALHMLGEILMSSDSIAAAEQVFRKAWTLKPDHETYRLGLVWALQEQGRNEEADQLLAHVQTQTGNAYYQQSLGISLAKQGRYQEALEAFRRADILEPHSLPEKVNLAIVFTQLRQPDSALSYFSAALHLADRETECSIREAMVEQYLAAARTAEAKRAFAEFEKECPRETAKSSLRGRIEALSR